MRTFKVRDIKTPILSSNYWKTSVWYFWAFHFPIFQFWKLKTYCHVADKIPRHVSYIDLFHENSRTAFFSRILLGKNCLAPLENGIFIFMIQMVMSRPIVQFKFIVTFYLPNFEYGRVVMLVASIFISSYRWKTYETIRVNTKL